MLEAVVEIAGRAGLGPIVAVVPPGIPVPPDVLPIVNDRPDAGLSRSLRMGFAALPADVDAAVILLGDQPTLAPETVRHLVEAASRERPVTAALAGGVLAPPVLLQRAAFGLAQEATGDLGLAPVLAAHPELVTAVEVGRHAADVDTPADLPAG